MSKNIEQMMTSPVFEKIRVSRKGSPKIKDYRQTKRQSLRRSKLIRQERDLNYGQTT